MSRHRIALTVLLLTSLMGCNKSKLQQEVMDDSTWETSTGEEKSLESRPSEKSEPESRLDQPSPRITSGTITRDELVSVLDLGLGRFLQNVETEAAFHKGGFVGFRIVSLFPGEPSFASLDLRPGDTVTAINGKPIERPEQAAAVWRELRTASHLVVDYQRDDQSHALRFAIVDAP